VRGIIVRLAIIGVIALGAFLLRDRISGSAASLAVGDCFDVPASETLEDVPHHPCNEAHDAEVVFVGDHPAAEGAVPLTDDDLQAFVMNTCGGALIAYVGGLQTVETNAELQNIDLGVIYPTEEDWNGGERKITCYLHSVDGTKLTKSYKVAA
jgi:hypothetical protein